jgi:hypothetical protein
VKKRIKETAANKEEKKKNSAYNTLSQLLSIKFAPSTLRRIQTGMAQPQ